MFPIALDSDLYHELPDYRCPINLVNRNTKTRFGASQGLGRVGCDIFIEIDGSNITKPTVACVGFDEVGLCLRIKR